MVGNITLRKRGESEKEGEGEEEEEGDDDKTMALSRRSSLSIICHSSHSHLHSPLETLFSTRKPSRVFSLEIFNKSSLAVAVAISYLLYSVRSLICGNKFALAGSPKHANEHRAD